MDTPLTRISLAILGALLGGGILLFGRKYYWALLGVVITFLFGFFLANFEGLEHEWQLLISGEWVSLLIALVAGGIGVLVGRWNRSVALAAIGFTAGAYIATYSNQLLLYLTGQTGAGLTWWLLLIFVAAGVLGAYFTRRNPDEALILISVTLGTAIVARALNLSTESSWTAVITLSLALVGVVLQFAVYVREQPAARGTSPTAVPAAPSRDLPSK